MNKYKRCALVEAVRFRDYPEIVNEIEGLFGKRAEFLRDENGKKFVRIMSGGRAVYLHDGEWLVVSNGGCCVMDDATFKKNYVDAE